MTQKEPQPKVEKPQAKKQVIHGAQQRCEAVLAVWMERRRPSQICRKLGIAEGVLLNWQDRALRGMLEALEPRKSIDGQGPWLPAKLDKKLRRQAAERLARQTKLSRRLEKIRDQKEAETG